MSNLLGFLLDHKNNTSHQFCTIALPGASNTFGCYHDGDYFWVINKDNGPPVRWFASQYKVNMGSKSATLQRSVNLQGILSNVSGDSVSFISANDITGNGKDLFISYQYEAQFLDPPSTLLASRVTQLTKTGERLRDYVVAPGLYVPSYLAMDGMNLYAVTKLNGNWRWISYDLRTNTRDKNKAIAASLASDIIHGLDYNGKEFVTTRGNRRLVETRSWDGTINNTYTNLNQSITGLTFERNSDHEWDAHSNRFYGVTL